MGTSALISFVDDLNETVHHVYQQYDGYPDTEVGVLAAIIRTLKQENTWTYPRYEADEFICGYIADHNKIAGGLRNVPNPECYDFVDYRYVVTNDGDGITTGVGLNVEVDNGLGEVKCYVVTK